MKEEELEEEYNRSGVGECYDDDFEEEESQS